MPLHDLPVLGGGGIEVRQVQQDQARWSRRRIPAPPRRGAGSVTQPVQQRLAALRSPDAGQRFRGGGTACRRGRDFFAADGVEERRFAAARRAEEAHHGVVRGQRAAGTGAFQDPEHSSRVSLRQDARGEFPGLVQGFQPARAARRPRLAPVCRLMPVPPVRPRAQRHAPRGPPEALRRCTSRRARKRCCSACSSLLAARLQVLACRLAPAGGRHPRRRRPRAAAGPRRRCRRPRRSPGRSGRRSSRKPRSSGPPRAR